MKRILADSRREAKRKNASKCLRKGKDVQGGLTRERKIKERCRGRGEQKETRVGIGEKRRVGKGREKRRGE